MCFIFILTIFNPNKQQLHFQRVKTYVIDQKVRIWSSVTPYHIRIISIVCNPVRHRWNNFPNSCFRCLWKASDTSLSLFVFLNFGGRDVKRWIERYEGCVHHDLVFVGFWIFFWRKGYVGWILVSGVWACWWICFLLNYWSVFVSKSMRELGRTI